MREIINFAINQMKVIRTKHGLILQHFRNFGEFKYFLQIVPGKILKKISLIFHLWVFLLLPLIVQPAIIGSFNGLYNFNPTTNNLEVLTSISSTPVGVRKIFRAGNGTIWIGHKNGLISYNPVTKTSRIISEIQSEIRVIGEDQDGFIWCYAGGTAWFSVGNQLIIIDPVTGGVKKSDSNIIRSMYKDNSGIMWLGTGWDGLKKWDKKKNKFNIYKHDPGNSSSISSNVVNSVAVDSNNILWIGTDKGLDKFDRLKGVIRHYKFKNDEVTVVHINKIDKYIWLGTRNNGLVRFDPVKETIHYYSHHSDDSTSISSNHVFGILTDHYGNIWVGSRNDGLNLLNSKTGKFKRYKKIRMVPAC
jgi:ligand-binding sensor domain-containing protein